MKYPPCVPVLCLVAASSLRADFTYEQSSKITGGAVAGAMKVAGAFSKAAREPMTMTTMVKGNRMAMVMPQQTTLIDLDRETITDVNHAKRTFSTLTFAQMSEAMERLARDAQQKRKPGEPEPKISAKVEQTGQTRQVMGMDAKETRLTLTIDSQSADASGGLVTSVSMYLVPNVAGYREVTDFQRRMATKMAFSPGSPLGGMMAAQPDAAKAMAEMYKQLAQLDGMPGYMVTSMGASGAGAPMPVGTTTAASAPGAPPPATPAPGDVARDAATGAATNAAANRMGRVGSLAGIAGGLGGFGRRKKEQPAAPTPEPAPAATPTEAATPMPTATPAPAAASGSLMQMETELTNFNSNALDAAKLEVPAGYKQVEHELLKRK